MTHMINEVFEQIREFNSLDSIDAIPHSDSFAKKLEIERGLERHEVSKIVNILKEAHKIFFIEVVKEDKVKDVKRIVGYVDANLTTIRRLRAYFQMRLVDEYQHQYKRKLPVLNIIKDLMTRPGQNRNSPLGQMGNKAMMLEEYENLILKEFHEYTDEWKTNKLNEIIQQFDDLEPKQLDPEHMKSAPARGARVVQTRRAVDSEIYTEFASTGQQQPVGKILKIYGVEFFYRVNLRKYEFTLLANLIEKDEINRKDDLKLLKSMLQKVRQNFDKDPILLKHEEALGRLEKTLLFGIISSKR